MAHTDSPDQEDGDRAIEVGRLIADLLERRLRGERPSLSDYENKLTSEAEREEFRSLTEVALRLEGSLPGPIEPENWFARYLVKNKLGQGGMGIVYRALDPELEREVALKVLSPEYWRDEWLRTQFQNESRILAQLKHPNIVTIHEAGSRGPDRYLVMDLVDGEPLSHVIEQLRGSRDGRLTGRSLSRVLGPRELHGRESLIDDDSYDRTVARIMREIVRGIEAAHASGVLHHDLNPKNVMLTAGAHPVVLDFGLARSARIANSPIDARLVGTIPYLAPEQLRATRVGTDPRTDIYGLGLILYELLVLERAFRGEGPQAVRDAICQSLFPWPRRVRRDVPKDLEAICLRAMASVPEQRYQTAGEMTDDLGRFLAGMPTLARPPGVLRRSFLIARRHPAISGMTLALAMGGFFGVAYQMRVTPAALNESWVRLDVASGRSVEIQPGELIYDGDFLAAHVKPIADVIIYAVSVSGVSGKSITLNPVHPVLVSDLASGKESSSWWLTLPRGRESMIGLSAVHVSDFTDGNQIEGAWLFGSRSRLAWLEAWLDQLAKLADEYAHGVPTEIALRALNLLADNRRGEPLVSLTEAQRKGLSKILNATDVNRVDTWPFADPRVVSATFVLHKALTREQGDR